MNAKEYQSFLQTKLNKARNAFLKSNNENREKILTDIATLSDTIENFQIKSEVVHFNKNYLLEELTSLEEIKFFWPYLDDFAKIVEFCSPQVSEKENHLKFKQTLYLVDNFFKKDPPKRIRDLYNMVNNQKNLCLVESNDIANVGYSIFLYTGKEVITQINPKYNYSDVLTLAYEFGHGISFLENANYTTETHHFQEVISCFFQNVITEFYKKTPLYCEANNYFNDILSDTEIIREKLTLLKNIYNNHYSLKDKNILDEIIKNTSDDTKDCLIDTPVDYSSPYIIASFIVANLIMIYLNDKEKAYHLVMKLMSLERIQETKEYLKRIEGIDLMNPNGIIDYSNHLKRKLSN